MTRKELIGTIAFIYIFCPVMAFLLIGLAAVFR